MQVACSSRYGSRWRSATRSESLCRAASADNEALRFQPRRVRTEAAENAGRPAISDQTRRSVIWGTLSVLWAAPYSLPPLAEAIGFKKDLRKRRGAIDPSLYTPLESGLQIYEIEEGKGAEIGPGTQLQVHYDCRYRGIDVVSSRAARLLGGNRIIAEPLDFIAGEPIVVSARQVDDRGGGGLFAGSSGPQPPPALSTAVFGMKRGGRRSVLVPPELGYGAKGMQEIPPNTSFELLIEVLQVSS